MSTSSTSALEAIAPIRTATAADSIDGVMPSHVVAPENEQQLSAVLAWANANDVHVTVRGGGSKLGWGNLPRAIDVVVSLENFCKINDHAWQDMTVTVQAGVTIAALQAELATHGQRLPLDALWPNRSTVGGVIATNDSGALRLRFGSVRDLILGVTVILANGTIARSGGRVVKNVAGYDLPKLFTGSYGTLGILTEVTLRTYPLPHSIRTISAQFADLAAANAYMLAIADTSLVPASMQLRAAPGEAPIVDICFEGLEAGIAAQGTRATQLASAGQMIATVENVWNTRESLWEGEEPAIVAKFSVLPSTIVACIQAIRSHFPNANVIAQSLGLGLFRAQLTDPNSAIALRESLKQLGGTLTLLHAPRELKQSIDVFGTLTSAYPLMVRTKQLFDPKGILSPGRFLGGI